MRRGALEDMVKDRNRCRCWMIALPALASHAEAAPIAGELGSNAASLLVILGIGALLMGMRNLRQLRHKRLVTGRHRHEPEETRPGDTESPTDG